MRTLLFLTCVLAGAFFPGSVCFADTVTFSFVPTAGAAAETVSFMLPTVPDVYVADDYSTYRQSPGATQFENNSDLYVFYADLFNPSTYLASSLPALDFDFAYSYYLSPGNPVSGIYAFTGVQLYTGSEASPSFTPGTYTLAYAPSFSQGYVDATDNQTISLTIAATPEPSSLLLIATGLACTGVAARRRLALVACRSLRPDSKSAHPTP